ncbi:zinc-binding alcohol dehydrogenase [Sinomonas atrocyanea]|uniref:zinc-dependent alcohol dehydrogenase n=1 Tax=Sinomonas atrocyanea TaxID=37927 RepID=UPI0027874BF1|nr:zinc-binding alcohol dehydrogenase [Sinomonas atrocyanea]MDQ0261606.1 threonine dehydrogenase-like Zn-dependent dehydrogenase [Sinomonas atrocyanea]MDR6621535.1 NADPH:quinone reductase-like Zn-dependent oxidoreductase [Sinomonas atrocyanea]
MGDPHRTDPGPAMSGAGTATATAYWTTGPRRGELRPEPVPDPGEGQAMVRTLYSGHSRGTENLVHACKVPERVADLMEAPHQEGSFPAPVKYGYLSVGVVERGPAELEGRTVFCLYPHQDRYVVPVADLTPVPEGVPPRRALLAGAVETAVNALWEAGPRIGDRIAVVGCGLIGSSAAALLRRFPLDRLEAVDPDPAREGLMDALGVRLVAPQDAAEDCDIVFHASATPEGLARCLEIVGDDGEVIELSWYGDRSVQVPLGADFHARRLSLRASQVGQVAQPRRVRRTTAERLALALRLLEDPAFDAFLGEASDFADLPATMDRLARGGDVAGAWPGLCHVIRYPGAP